VTEAITGVDLVELQLRVAAGVWAGRRGKVGISVRVGAPTAPPPLHHTCGPERCPDAPKAALGDGGITAAPNPVHRPTLIPTAHSSNCCRGVAAA
jgi:hypothetical protein